MPRFQPKRQEQIETQMYAQVVSRTDLSDVGDSSGVKHVLKAAARQDDEQYYQMSLLLELFSIDTATGDDLDERAKDIQPGVITRIQAVKATGSVIFSRAGTSGTVSIPVGTQVKTPSGQVFTTDVSVQITPTSPEQIGGHGVGRDSPSTAVTAVVPGAAGTVASGTITKFGSKPPGVDEVINLVATQYGFNKESDDSFKNRLKTFIASLARCPLYALEVAVLGQQDVATGATILFSKGWENAIDRGYVILYIDDGSGTAETFEAVPSENVTLGLAGPPPDSAVGGETTLYLDYKPVREASVFTLVSSTRGTLVIDTDFFLNPASGQIDFDPALTAAEVITASYTRYTGLIALAQKIIDGDPNDRENYPGWRAGGVLVRVRTPQVLIQNIVASVTVAEGYDQVEVKNLVREEIKDYINSLTISGDLILATLISRIMAVAGVYNVVIVTPATDIIILDDQISRTSDPNITIT